MSNELKTDIGARLREVIANNNARMTKVAGQLDIPESTLSKWIAGIHYPAMASLVKFARLYKVSLDWILTGQESLLPKDQREEDFIIRYRKLVEQGVAEDIDLYMTSQLTLTKIKNKIKATRGKATRAFQLNTFGKRLCYIRESEEGLAPKEMGDRIGLTERDYLKIEGDEILPGTRELTALTGYLMDPETKDQTIIDWLLEG